MNWTESHIKNLKASGKIKSFNAGMKVRQTNSLPTAQDKKSKALAWLKWNLWYWANQNSIVMETEHRFCTDRKWRFDFAFPSIKVAVEFEGGIYIPKSGHKTARHYTKDTDKYNRAVTLGWRVIRVTALNYQTVLDQLNKMI